MLRTILFATIFVLVAGGQDNKYKSYENYQFGYGQVVRVLANETPTDAELAFGPVELVTVRFEHRDPADNSVMTRRCAHPLKSSSFTKDKLKKGDSVEIVMYELHPKDGGQTERAYFVCKRD